MRIYSYRERVAGLLLLFALLGVTAFIVASAIENHWLEPRISYNTHVVQGDGLREGSPVLLSGIEVGEVGKLEILDDNRIDVEILVRERHAHRVRAGMVAEVRRLLGIGEKRVHLISGKGTGGELPPDANLPANEPMDILDVVSNTDLSKYITTLDRAVSAMEVVLSKLEEGRRLVRMMEAFDQMGPTMKLMNNLLAEINEPMIELFQDKSLRRFLRGADRLFNDPNTRKMVKAMSRTFEPERMESILGRLDKVIGRFDMMLAEDSHFSGAMAGTNRLLNDGRMDRMLTAMEKLSDVEKLEKLVDNLSSLANETAKIGPEIPTLSRELVETMRELSIVLKALQKTWLLDNEAAEVRKERKKEKSD